jgi:hypothetical protein
MGIIFIPLTLIMFSFIVPGAKFSFVSIRASKNRLLSVGLLLFFILAEYLVGFLEPLFLLSGKTVGRWELYIDLCFYYLVISVVAGLALLFIYRYTKKNWLLFLASSLFLSTALYPVVWISFVEPRLWEMFRIQLDY